MKAELIYEDGSTENLETDGLHLSYYHDEVDLSDAKLIGEPEVCRTSEEPDIRAFSEVWEHNDKSLIVLLMD